MSQFAPIPNAVTSIAMYGGSFDPVHLGHLRSALEVRQTLGIDELRFVPSGNPPHRQRARVEASDRLHMLELAVRDTPGIVVDPREIHSSAKSYTIDTLESLSAEFPQARLTLIIGMDQFSVFDTWHRWQELLQRFDLAVMERPGEPLSDTGVSILSRSAEPNVTGVNSSQATKPDGHHGGRINIIAVTQLQISSSQIRRDLAEQRDIRFLVPLAVRDYIYDHGLYVA